MFSSPRSDAAAGGFFLSGSLKPPCENLNTLMITQSTLPLEDAATLPTGYAAAGVHCGIKPAAPDLALFVSEAPAAVAGTFTTNQVQAAPVRLGRGRLSGGVARAIVMNSGNANACTGAAGMRDAERMGALTGELLNIPAEQVFMSSTGPIGLPLPMEKIESGIRKAVAALTPDGGAEATAAMMTTDTRPKHVTVTLSIDGASVRLTGIAKGSGMIHPGMATMLSYLFTDARVEAGALQACLSGAVNRSFNRITVDGDRSTNDTVLFLANGMAGNQALQPGHPDWEAFVAAVRAVTLDLALRIVSDGEGATRTVTIRVKGASSDDAADRAARAIGNSLLIKTSWAGGDPNWSRVLCALGYSGAGICEETVDIDYDDVPAVRGGLNAGSDVDQLRAVAQRSAYTIGIHLHAGRGEAVVYACDTTEAYVRINVEE